VGTVTIATQTPVPTLDVPTTAGIAVGLFIVGLAIGWLVFRRRS